MSPDRSTVELPRLLLLTDRHQATRPLTEVVSLAVDAGVRAIVLREKDLAREHRTNLARALARAVHGADGILLAAGEDLPYTDGVHLPASAAVDDRPRGLAGRSCHDAGEIQDAEHQGVDYVTVSPVFPTRSKPGYGPGLDSTGLTDLAAMTSVPVYALGGVESAEQVRQCRRAGAHGVAVMGALMRHTHPDRLARELVGVAEERR